MAAWQPEWYGLGLGPGLQWKGSGSLALPQRARPLRVCFGFVSNVVFGGGGLAGSRMGLPVAVHHQPSAGASSDQVIS